MLLAQPGPSWFVLAFSWTCCDGCSDTTHHAGVQGENLLGSGGAGPWSIPGAAALLGRIFPKSTQKGVCVAGGSKLWCWVVTGWCKGSSITIKYAAAACQ